MNTLEEKLISKKDLLEETGISYGSLYRWKRKKLIPEEWFIRKSTFTGQETYFPREKILARIHKIINMKEDMSLDDLAKYFLPHLSEIILSKKELIERNIVTGVSVELYTKIQGERVDFPFERLLHVYILDKMLQSGEINLAEGEMVLQTLADEYKKFKDKACDVLVVRKLGVTCCLFYSSHAQVYFDKGSRIVARLSISDSIEELKLKIHKEGL